MASIKTISRLSSRRVIYAAILGDFLIGMTKFGAAAWTGSASLLSEGVHSLVDTGNGFLLLYGLRRASLRPDREHPLGYGREIYFWSFVVAVLLFAFGAGVSLYEGVLHVLNPAPENMLS
jgi:divalent metal cation (Fe/Co/Zn/Cd) transporter